MTIMEGFAYWMLINVAFVIWRVVRMVVKSRAWAAAPEVVKVQS